MQAEGKKERMCTVTQLASVDLVAQEEWGIPIKHSQRDRRRMLESRGQKRNNPTTDFTWNWVGMHIPMNPCMYHVGTIMDEPCRYLPATVCLHLLVLDEL